RRGGMRLPRARPGDAGQDGGDGTSGPAPLASPAQGPHPTHGQTRLLSLRLRATPRYRGRLAQDPGSPPRHGPSLRARDAVAAAVAAGGEGFGLSPGRGQRSETVEGPVRLL